MLETSGALSVVFTNAKSYSSKDLRLKVADQAYRPVLGVLSEGETYQRFFALTSARGKSFL